MNVVEIFTRTPTPPGPDYRQVKIVIGGDGIEYDRTFPHFEITGIYNEGPHLILRLPNSVAEMFRQQGRRQLQSDLRELIGARRL